MSHLTTFYIQSIVLISIHKTFKFPKVSAMYYSQQNIPLQQNPARLPSTNFQTIICSKCHGKQLFLKTSWHLHKYPSFSSLGITKSFVLIMTK